MKNKWLLKFTAISAGTILLVIHLIITSVWSEGEKRSIRDRARQQAISANETLSTILRKEEDNLNTLLGVGSIRDKGRLLSLTSNYESGYLFSLRSREVITLFGKELNTEESSHLQDEVRSRWNQGRSPFSSINYINLQGRVYSLKYLIDFEERENYILILNIRSSLFNQVAATSKEGLRRELTLFNNRSELISSTGGPLPENISQATYHETDTMRDFSVSMFNENFSWKTYILYPDIYRGIVWLMLQKAFMITLPFGVLLLGIIYLFSRKFYLPLQNLISFFEEHIEEDPEKEISQLLQVKSSYEKSLPQLREQGILKFIKKEGLAVPEEFFPDFKGFYLLIILPQKAIMEEGLKDLLSLWESHLEMLRDEQDMILIFRSHDRERLEMFHEDFEFLKGYIVSFSRVHQNIDELSTAYKEAAFGIYSSIKFYSSIITQKMLMETSSETDFSDEESREFLRQLKLEDRWMEDFTKLLDRIFTSNLTVINLKFTLTKLLADIYNFSIENNLPRGSLSIEELYFQMDSLRSRGRIEEFFSELVSDVRSSLDRIRLEEDQKIVRAVEDYIQQNYSRVSFTISDISEEIGYSISHIERKFKSVHSMSLKSFLISKRLEEAKEILARDPHIRIKDVAYKVGYDNSKSFTNIFKKYEETTPGEYRKNIADH